MVVTVVVFVEVALVGKMVWFVLTPLSSKWLGTGFTLLELTPVLSRLLSLALGFELQVDGSENNWLISGVVLRPHTPVVTWRYITFGDGGQGLVNCEEMIKVSKFCDHQVCGPGQATWFVLLHTLSHVCKVSFVCFLASMHEFRVELVSFVFLCSFTGGVEPSLPPLDEPVVCEFCVGAPL
jgi:hypothetical protein